MDELQFAIIRRDISIAMVTIIIAIAFFAVLGYRIESKRFEELKQPCTEQTEEKQ